MRAATTGRSLESAAEYYDIDLGAPVRTIPKDKLGIILYGTHGKQVPMTYRNPKGREYTFDREFEGVIPNLERRYNETSSEYPRERISRS